MKPIMIIGIFAVVIIFLFLIGGTIETKQCFTISSHTACWDEFAVDVPNGEFCSRNRCSASPDLQEYNAYIDVINDACLDAKNAGYGDVNLNNRIEDAVNRIINQTLSIPTLCENPGIVLAKKSYD